SSPAPCIKIDLPYAVALRELFREYKMRAQMNTKYIESCTREATVSHTLNLLISKLTSSDIQSTITPDEGRNVPWHYNNIHAINTAKQALLGMDGLMDMIELKKDGYLREKSRELKERAVLFLEEILEAGGYFKAVQEGFFVDSGEYPERNGDGISRKINGGIGTDSIVERKESYYAPVCAHFGYNKVPKEKNKPCMDINECTLCCHSKVKYIDELDEEDNVNKRLERSKDEKLIVPEVEWNKDGTVAVTLFIPEDERISEAAAIDIGRKMNLKDVEVIHKQILQKSEGTLIEIKGKVTFKINKEDLIIKEQKKPLSDDYLKSFFAENPIKVVAATVGEDEHSVGLRETIDIKHGGIEKYGIECIYLGTSCPVEKLLDAAIETKSNAVLVSTIITHNDIHIKNMKKINELAIEKGIRDKFIIIAGGTQVTDDLAKAAGMDGGFGRGSKGMHVATFILEELEKKGLA
uniref:OAM dimerization domain-containing protein n=1 Tax=Clostridium polynesiense TaxID=1325933 RepID=UPI00058BFCA9